VEIWTPYNTCSLASTRVHIPNDISIGSAGFAQLTAESAYAYNGPSLFPSQNCPFTRGIWTTSDNGSLAHRSPQPKRHLRRFSRFCGSQDRDRPTDKPTDHATQSVKIGRIYVVLRCGLIIFTHDRNIKYTSQLLIGAVCTVTRSNKIVGGPCDLITSYTQSPPAAFGN